MRHLRIFFAFILFLSVASLQGTHIRAGEIIARRISSLTYQFTFIGYRDSGGEVNFGGGIFRFGDGDIYGDDEAESVEFIKVADLGNLVERWEFTITHTYSGAGNYLVSYEEKDRNADIQNIANSVVTPFYVETLIIIDPLIYNNTPLFSVPPIDAGLVGEIFEHSPGAYDPEGDSLVFYFVEPKQTINTPVNGYRSLVDPAFYDDFSRGNSTADAAPTLTIDRNTGLITWDAPGGKTIPNLENREFNVAFVVEEWRKIGEEYIRLSTVTRDMQIVIWDAENDPPVLEVPEDLCVVAGTSIREIITANDPNGDSVQIEAYGGSFEVVAPRSSYSPFPARPRTSPAQLIYDWSPTCAHVRDEPYSVQFKVTDFPAPVEITINNITRFVDIGGLTRFKEWKITVVGPPPSGLTVTPNDSRSFQLDWDLYECIEATSMQLWRRVGSFDFNQDCFPGIPEGSGYELIAQVPISTTTYLDTMDVGIGPNYCYRLVAVFGENQEGKSIASEEICTNLSIENSVITNVDIIKTDSEQGEIFLRWTTPLEVNPVIHPPSYFYNIYRMTVNGNNTFELVASVFDTTFADVGGLNTRDSVYSYRLEVSDVNFEALGTTLSASSVRLETTSLSGGVELTWQAEVPWSNVTRESPFHYIYRDHVTPNNVSGLVLIDSVDVTTQRRFLYHDDGGFNNETLDNDTTYCYYVTTVGSYGNPILPSPLLNSSQIACAQPGDTIPPCTPLTLAIDDLASCEEQVLRVSCENIFFENKLVWNVDEASTCQDDIASYNIYYGQDEASEFMFLGESSTTSFIHAGLTSLEGCYRVTAVDRTGNESVPTEIICIENCPRYLLPNVITPNNDGENDTFSPFTDVARCPRFVETVKIIILSRTGSQVFEYDSEIGEHGIYIDWDATNDNGKEVPAGGYFYSAKVKYLSEEIDNQEVLLKGWIQVVR